MKKILLKISSVFIAMLIVLSMGTISFAAEAADKTAADFYEIELSVAELEEGVTIALCQDLNGTMQLKKISSDNNDVMINRATVQATFHVGITRTSSTSAYLHWNATGNQLTKVEAKVFCKSTSLLSPKYYFNNYISGYNDLSGRYNQANGVTSNFSIPSNTKKVRVGWSNAYVTTVTQGKMSMASASQAVSI